MAIGAHLGAKMAPSWPTWCQDVPKMANLEVKMANLAHFWEHFLDLGRDLAKNGENQKNDDSSSLWEVFRDPGGGLGGWRYVGACWRHLGATWR